MAFSFGVFTSDPNLLRCELARLKADVLMGDPASEPLGAGWYADDNVLLQRYAPSTRPASLELLGGVLESESLVVYGGPLPLGVSLEENAQPYRFRSWLFAAQGQFAGGDRFRARVMDSLPDHLARAVRGAMPQELCFAVFLAALREGGWTDDVKLDAKSVAHVIGKAARQVEQFAQEAEGRLPSFACIATNDRVLGAGRVGDQPLYFRLLEGSSTCEVCRLDGSPESQPSVRAHLRRKTVVVATEVRDPQGWMALDSHQAIGVGRTLNVEKVGF